MSRKPCSSNSEHSHSADSTSASAVALPYFCSSRGSSEPALTPIRIGTPASAAALAISPTLSSNFLMLPGLTRTAAQPASMAAKTYLGWKWMSAMTGICDLRAMAGSASTSSWDGTATRTIWQPDAVSSAICCSVALTSAVSVVVIDCTETGAPPPTGTEPTMIWRLLRRSASGGGGAAGIPRLIAVTECDLRTRFYLKSVIGLTMSAATVSRVNPPKIRMTAYVTASACSSRPDPGRAGPAGRRATTGPSRTRRSRCARRPAAAAAAG